MASINVVNISGRLAKKPDIRDFGSFKGANLSVVVSRRYMDKNKQPQEEVSFIDCTVIGKLVDIIEANLDKGSALSIKGRLKQEKWNDKETGKERSKMVVAIEDLFFAASPATQQATREVDINEAPRQQQRPQAQRTQQAQGQRPQQKLRQPQADFVDTDPFADSDLPF